MEEGVLEELPAAGVQGGAEGHLQAVRVEVQDVALGLGSASVIDNAVIPKNHVHNFCVVLYVAWNMSFQIHSLKKIILVVSEDIKLSRYLFIFSQPTSRR